ncbi:MAG: LEA type 2 family protein [Gemmatimonadaceae bacterium]
MRKPILPIAAALALAATLACQAALDRVFTPPLLTFRGVTVRGVGLGGGSLDIALHIANANRYGLSARRATYRLLVRDSLEVGRGVADGVFAVAARDTAIVHLPLDVTWTGLRAAGRAALGGGTVTYRVVGDIVADTPIGARTIPLDTRGQFAALRVGR